MTRKAKNRTYIAITMFALGALFVDRFMLTGSTGPAEASAQETAQDIAARVQALTPTGLSIPELPFPRHLPAARPAALQRDLFAPRQFQPEDNGSIASSRERKEKSDAAKFASHKRLDAVISDGRAELAVVNGLWIRVGQSLDGCVLTRIEGTRAHFECSGQAAVLDLQKNTVTP